MDGQIPVSKLRSTRLVRIDDDQLRAFMAGLFDEWPQVHIVAVDVGSPRDDVARVRELLGLRAELGADHGLQTFFAGSRTDAALELRCTQPVKKAPIHGSAVESTERASVRVREDGFRAGLGDDPAESARDFVERFVPGDALKSLRGWSSRATWTLEDAFFPPHGVEDPVRGVDAIQVLRDLRAEESARHRVRGVTLNLGGAAVFDGDQDTTGVGTIVRTR